ncbi:hypothetical protein [Spirosoma endophyticum]|uniref:Uncharacterized protein n=1 Tax=Spirosoma endophyticum TaxID=662367 RepID=A0A1I1SUV2_9BACT|nr:hypothetical protein [Spirosoma endophyticum]SFD47683.1 hypothetical protein SAMN05216167_105163 [Spirosoma endophyticum]
MNRIDIKDLLAIDGGLAYIVHRYPDARESETKSSRKFKIRNEKTASAGLKKMKDGTWIVTDFGEEQKGKNAVTIAMEEDNVDFLTALHTVAAFYQFEGVEMPTRKPIMNKWTAKPEEAEGVMSFDFKEFDLSDIRSLYAEYAWRALGHTDEARMTAGIQKATYLHLKCLKSYTHTKNGVTREYTSTELFPIFLWDEGDWKKLYKPRAEKAFRFQSYGKKPDHFIHGLDQAQKKFGQLQAQADAESYDPDAPDAEEKRKQKKLPELMYCSGGSDALNVFALGYDPIWPNSETAELLASDVKEFFRIADALYNIPDIDGTGKKAAHKLAMEYLAMKTIWLPEELREFRDGNGNSCKDLRDYLNRFRKFDFDELKRVAIPYQFWDEDVSRDKEGKVRFKFGKPMAQFVFNNVHGYNFLFRNGFARIPSLKEKDGFTFVHVHNNIVKPIDPSKVKDFIHGFLEERKMATDLRNTMYRTPQLSDSSLANLPLFYGDFKTYGPDYQYIFFQKSAWKITAAGIAEEKAGSLDKVIWEHKVIQHKAKLMDEMFTISKTADGLWDIDIKDKSCMFFRFLIQTCRVHWRKELEERLKMGDMSGKDRKKYQEQYGLSEEEMDVMLVQGSTAENRADYKKTYQFAVDGGLLLPDEIAEQKLHLVNRIFAIGYALHRYKNPARPWAVFAMDNKLSDDGESHGGAGKGLVAKALYKLATKVQLDGRNPKLAENPHVFENVDADTDLIHVEDANEFLNFGFFFAPLTSSMTINPKQKRSFELGFDDSPKFWFDTNFGDRMTDPSSLRRKLYTVFGDYYHENNGDYKESWTPNDDFGKSLFTDFTEEDWNAFYNFMAQCLRFYLSCEEKIIPPMTNVSKRNLMSEMGDHFRGWAEVFFSPEAGNLDKLVLKEDAMKDFENSTKLKTFSSQRFLKALKSWTKLHEYTLNPAELLNSQGRIVRRPNGSDTPKEMVYVRTVDGEIDEL